MAGTVAGGKAAAETNKRNDPNFYARIGAMGGAKSNTGGFATRANCNGSCDLNHILGSPHRKAQCAGYKGGQISRRSKKS